MKLTIDNAYIMKEIFIKWNRDYYTIAGLEVILNYYDEIDPDMEFDPVAICCDCTEYGEGAACSMDDLINDYSYNYTIEEYKKDDDIRDDEYDKEEYIKVLLDVLEDYTTVLHASNGNVIVFHF